MKNLNTIIVSFIFLFLLSLTFVSAVPTYSILKTNVNASFIRGDGNGNLFIGLRGSNSLQGINSSSNYVKLSLDTLGYTDYGVAPNGTHFQAFDNPYYAKNYVNYNGTEYLFYQPVGNYVQPQIFTYSSVLNHWVAGANNNAGSMSGCFISSNRLSGFLQGFGSTYYGNNTLYMGGTTYAVYNYIISTQTFNCILDNSFTWDNTEQGKFGNLVYNNNYSGYTNNRKNPNVMYANKLFGRKFFFSNETGSTITTAIGIDTSNKIIIRTNVTPSVSWAGTNTIPASCTTMNNLLSAYFTSVSCLDTNDCVFGGSYSYFGRTVPLLVTYQSGVCGQVDLPTTINDTVIDIDNTGGKYYFITTNKELGQVGAPYNVPQQATPINIALVNTNSKVVGELPYVYPAYTNQNIIGYFNVQTDNIINYGAVTCDYTETSLLNDYFNYDVPSANGWLYSEPYTTQTFDVTFGRSLYLNSTNNVTSSIEKAFNPTFNDTKISFLIKPQSLKTPLDQSQDVYTSLRSTLNQDVVPLHFIYDDNVDTMCVAGFIPTETTLMCFPYSNSYVIVEIYLKFISDTFSIVVTDAEGNSYYSNTLPIYYAGANNIGKFYINPVSSQSDTYFDNLNITIVPLYPSLTLRNLTFTQDLAGTSYDLFGIHILTDFNHRSYVQTTQVSNQSLYTEQCQYQPNLCYKTRFYNQGTNQNAYNNYADFDVCATTDSTISETDIFLQANQGVDVNGKSTGLTQVQKYLVVLFSILVVFGGFVVVGFTTDTIKMSTIMGMVVSVFGVIIFTVLGWIPAWIIVVIVILALAIIIVLPQFKQAPSG